LKALIEQLRLENNQFKGTQSNLESEVFGRDRHIQELVANLENLQRVSVELQQVRQEGFTLRAQIEQLRL
jgi:hypothetical protein